MKVSPQIRGSRPAGVKKMGAAVAL